LNANVPALSNRDWALNTIRAVEEVGSDLLVDEAEFSRDGTDLVGLWSELEMKVIYFLHFFKKIDADEVFATIAMIRARKLKHSYRFREMPLEQSGRRSS